MSSTTSESIYEYDHGVYTPSKWAGSPWSPSMQHGGPVNGLFAREFEQIGDEAGMQVARVTIDLFKAVPMVPLVADTRVLRRGGRIAAVESTLHPVDDDTPVSRATGLLVRAAPHAEPYWEASEHAPPAFDQVEPTKSWIPSEMQLKMPPGFHESIESRSGVDEGGPFVWMATRLELVEGEAISSLQRATALCDMTLGFQMRTASSGDSKAKSESSMGSLRGLMINTDTTVYWERPFVGEHLAFRPSHIAECDGVGMAEAVLYDAQGRVGRSIQTALVQKSMGDLGMGSGG